MFFHKHDNFARIAVFSVTIALVAAFHFLLAGHAFGLGAAIFFVCLVFGIHIVDLFAEKDNNFWSYIFLVPLVAAAIADSLFANGVVRFFSFPIMVLSAALFAYWFSAPKIGFWRAPVLWPAAAIRETVWPFSGLKEVTSGIGKNDRWRKVLLGLFIAAPFVILIGGLFVSGDAVFGKAVAEIFYFENLPDYVSWMIRDIIVGLYLLSGGWMVYTRSRDSRGVRAGQSAESPDKTVLVTVLSVLNLLFLAFIIVQVTAFFGGMDFVARQGITYADYARQGFFQLLAVAGIVFVIVLAVYRHTHLRETFSRILALALIAQTGVVIASAFSRLVLYIDTYGLTLSRYWAMIIIIAVAVVLASVFISAIIKLDYEPVIRTIFIGALILFPLLFLFNAEGFVVKYNFDRFVAGKTKILDVQYFAALSSDAVPALSRVILSDWPVTAETPADLKIKLNQNTYNIYRQASDSVSAGWRIAVVADYRAVAAFKKIINLYGIK
jgi:hypothetical protein